MCFVCTAQPMIVAEFAGGSDLATYLHLSAPASKQRVWQLLYEAALGLAHLHDHGVVHGNLKLSNILVTDAGIAKASDYGVRRVRTGPQSTSLRWCAPESLKGESPTVASDVYSLGACIFAAVTGQPPFALVEDDLVYRLVRDGQVPSQPRELSTREWALVQAMMCADPAKRKPLCGVIAALKTFASHNRDAVDAEQVVSVKPDECIHDLKRLALCGGKEEQLLAATRPMLQSIHDSVSVPERLVAIVTLAAVAETNSDAQTCIGGTGVITDLIGILREGPGALHAAAARALGSLMASNHNDNQAQVVAGGAIPPLLGFLRDSDDADRTCAACFAVEQLAQNEAAASSLTKASVRPLLTELVMIGSLAQKQAAVAALVRLQERTNSSSSTDQGITLQQLTDLVRDDSDGVKECGYRLLASFPDGWAVAGYEELVQVSVACLRQHDAHAASLQELVVAALLKLMWCSPSDEIRGSVFTAGAIDPLATMLKGANKRLGLLAASALATLACQSTMLSALERVIDGSQPVRFLVRRIGDCVEVVRAEAIETLLNLYSAQRSTFTDDLLACDASTLFVQVLMAEDQRTVDAALRFMCFMAIVASERRVVAGIVSVPLIERLLELACIGDEMSAGRVATILQQVTQRVMLKAGVESHRSVIQRLVNVVRKGPPSEARLRVLGFLCAWPPLVEQLVDAGAIPPIVEALATSGMAYDMTDAVYRLASHSEEVCDALEHAGAVDRLLVMIRDNNTDHYPRYKAGKAISQLLKYEVPYRAVMERDGEALLKSWRAQGGVHESADKALKELARTRWRLTPRSQQLKIRVLQSALLLACVCIGYILVTLLKGQPST